MSESVRKAPVFNEAGEETSGQPKPEHVLLSDGKVGCYIGEGLGLYLDPDTEALNVAPVFDHGDDDLPSWPRFPSDYEVYFATMVIRCAAPIIISNWEDDLPLSDEELETYYALPVIEDHQLPKPPDGGL
jgi:hypothetical protein